MTTPPGMPPAGAGMTPSQALEIVGLVAQADDLSSLGEEEYRLYRKAAQLVAETWDTSTFATMFPATGPLRRELYPKHMEFIAAGRHAVERCFFGGNRVAKTWTCGYEFAAHVTGRYPDWWFGHRFNEPVMALAAGKTNETTFNVIQKNLFGIVKKSGQSRNYVSGGGIMPLDAIDADSIVWRTTSIATLIQQIHVRYKDSKDELSTVTLASYEQKRRAFEGFERHVVWLDEEVPSDIYEECLIRTATVFGRIMLSFTPLDGVTDVVLSFVPGGVGGSQGISPEPWDPLAEADRGFRRGRAV